MNIYSVASLIATVFCLILGSFVFIRKRKDRRQKLFGIASLFTGFWTSFPFVISIPHSEETALFFARLIYLPALFVPPSWLHFILVVVKRKLSQKERGALILSYGISSIFLLVSFSPYFISGVKRSKPFFAVQPGPLFPVFIVAFGFIFGYIIKTIYEGLKTSDGHQRNQLKYLFLSFAFGFVSGSFHFGAAFFDIELIPHDVFIVVYTGLMAYGIFKYRIMDISIAFKKTMVYSISVGSLTGVFVVLVLVSTRYLTGLAGIYELRISIFSALVIAFLFNPLKNRIQKIIDKLFYKTTYDYYAAIQKAGTELSTRLHMKEIQEFIVGYLVDVLKVKSAHFLVVKKKHFESSCSSALKQDDQTGRPSKGQRLNANARLTRLLKIRPEIIIREELLAVADQDEAEEISAEMSRFSGEVAVPLKIDGELKGIIILGTKQSGDVFTEEDISLLKTIANETALSMKSAGLYAEKMSAQKRATELSTLGMTAATLAHEIKNPLTAIKTFSQMLADKYHDQEFRDTYTRLIPGEIERIDKLLSELLSFSKQAPHKSEIAEIDVTVMLEDVLKLYSEVFTERNINVKKIFEDNLVISGDEDRIKQALINILSNSYQSVENGGNINIITQYNGKAVITIEDDGPGINEKDIEKIFDPFFTTKASGSGLGLTICKKIVDEHKGAISVASKPFESTKFIISFSADALSESKAKEQPSLWDKQL